MPGILADNDVEGHFTALLNILQSEIWQEIWTEVKCAPRTFENLGLPRNVSDLVLWQTCQLHQVVLVTANRNAKGSDSLELTIRKHNTPASLPVFTLANADRILESKQYGERVAERLLEHLLGLDNLRGTGRIYIP